MTLAEFKEMTKGKAEITLSPLEWDELKPHVHELGGVTVHVDPDALAAWEQARKDDAQRELDRRAAAAEVLDGPR